MNGFIDNLLFLREIDAAVEQLNENQINLIKRYSRFSW